MRLMLNKSISHGYEAVGCLNDSVQKRHPSAWMLAVAIGVDLSCEVKEFLQATAMLRLKSGHVDLFGWIFCESR